jgi:hypothetical protein
MKTLKSLLVIIILYAISYQVCAGTFAINYNNQIPKKLTFQIEIILDSNKILPSKITDIFPNYLHATRSNQNIYLLGEFPNEKRAELYAKAINSVGHFESKVVAFFRQKRISMKDALTLANNYNRYDDQVFTDDMCSKHKSSILEAENFASSIHYSLELDRNYPLAKIAEIDNTGFTVVLMPNGNYKIELKYKSFDEAFADKNYLYSKGIKGILLLAYSDNELITLSQAKQFEKSYNSYLALSMTK